MSEELKLKVPEADLFNELTQEFIHVDATTLTLKHSLLSLSKWESKWKIPFMENKPVKTKEQMIDYVKCMTLTKNVDPNVYLVITPENWKTLENYISDPMTATWFNDKDKPQRKKEVVTSEIIYFWMIAQNIPMECEKWHLNRLMALIRVCSIKNSPPKKMGKNQIFSRNKALNEARKKAYGTKG